MSGGFESIPLGESVVADARRVREALDAELDHDVRRLAEHAERVTQELIGKYGFRVAPAVQTRRMRRSAP